MKKTRVKEIPNDVDHKLKEIGKRVRSYRKIKSSNYEDFANDFHFNKVTLSRIENGENYTLSSLVQLLNLLDVTLETITKNL